MHDTEDPTRSSAADAAGMAADYSARATYARGYEDGLRAANCVSAATYAKRCAERDAAIAARDEAVARAKVDRQWAMTLAKQMAALESDKHTAIRARDEVGIQYAAAQAEIARLRPVVEAARHIHNGDIGHRHALADALRALDTVPGDALAPVGAVNGVPVYVDPALPDGHVRRVPPSPAGESGQPCGGTPGASSETSSVSSDDLTCLVCGRVDVKGFQCWRVGHLAPKITAALEASGIDTSNVKGVG